jgi:hypothetical protein
MAGRQAHCSCGQLSLDIVGDNTGTMRHALAYDHSCGRLMHRTKLEGEESLA